MAFDDIDKFEYGDDPVNKLVDYHEPADIPDLIEGGNYDLAHTIADRYGVHICDRCKGTGMENPETSVFQADEDETDEDDDDIQTFTIGDTCPECGGEGYVA